MAVRTPPSAARVSPDVLIRATATEKTAIHELVQFLGRHPTEEASILIDGQKQALPGSTVRALRRLIMYLGRDNAVTLVPHAVELTTQAAADLLGVSRPHLVSLCEKGKIQCTWVGSHRRLKLDAVLAYRDAQIASQRKAMNRLSRIDQAGATDGERPKLRRHGS